MTTWTASAWPILEILALKSTLILAVAWLLAACLRGRSAAARHVVWTGAMAALVALPFLSNGLPNWRHPFANAVLPAPDAFFQTTATARAEHYERAATHTAAVAGRPQAQPNTLPATGGLLVLLWAAGALLGVAQMSVSYIVMARLRRNSRHAAHAHPPEALELGISHPVDVIETPYAMPMTFGVMQPVVFLPERAEWDAGRRRMVLLHELAHVARGDAGTQWIGRTALALYWFHPLAWIAWREFLKERERAADDVVLGAGAIASEYAGHLFEVARTVQEPPATLAAGVCMARKSQLEGRLLSILDPRINRTRTPRGALVMAMLAALLFTIPLATVRAQTQSERAAPPGVDATILAANAQKNHQLLEDAAIAYETLRQFAEAQRLREAALVIREQVAGQRSKEYQIGLIKLGDLMQRRNQYKDANEFYARAAALGDIPEIGPALLALGRAAYADHNPAEGDGFMERARNVAKTGNEQASVLMWRGYYKQHQRDGEAAAENLYRAAIGIADPDSADQALAMDFLARLLRAQERNGEAEPLEVRANAMHKVSAAAISRPRSVASTAKRVGGPVTAPALKYKIEPEYSEAARAVKFQGTVLVRVVVEPDGSATGVEVLRGLGYGLDEKAVEAISHWKFKPGTMGGVPVPVEAQIEVNFRLM